MKAEEKKASFDEGTSCDYGAAYTKRRTKEQLILSFTVHPSIIKGNIIDVYDPRPHGHCGFRAAAYFLHGKNHTSLQ
ncbi:uncharacterized protein B0P05DRAFT_521288 [Gilbertella persicaria]|uniref:uncharacterized protein n=1 Tax=Gilbertella persicaria TaxID=101096 RepID=UPI0022209F7F|nr:uncharacterized protein B0P05DRAFT_521288 [Gilbertella persicaria]KAI8098298.1 hypothetical protein B0P05DRAFT_521288 [Gilbertella persicaria]